MPDSIFRAYPGIAYLIAKLQMDRDEDGEREFEATYDHVQRLSLYEAELLVEATLGGTEVPH